MKPIVTFVLLALPILAAAGYAAAGDRGREIIVASDERTKADSEQTSYRMRLLDAEGGLVQERELEVYFRRGDGEERTLQKFRSPPVLEGTGMLIVDAGEQANDIWLYLPATRRVRRIAGAEKGNRYMGTEFTYEDFEDYQIPFYDFSLLREAPCGEERSCHVIEAVPATAAEEKASGYSKKVYWIEAESLYPVRVDYYTEGEHQAKQVEASGLEQVEGYWRPAELVMRNLDNGRSTRLIVVERKINAGLDDYYVSRRYLRED